MLDADLAEIYGYSTGAFNQQVKNNIEKFDDDFRFQITQTEFASLISKFLISNRGGTRKMPYAFTEQGIYMLMTVLKGEQATAQSKALIRLFKQMKDYLVDEIRQDVSIMKTDLQKVMENFVDPSTHKHFLILNGQRLELAMNKTRDKFHDRYIFLDYGHKNEKLFHCGASSKDAGNKITTIMQIEYTQAYRSIMALLEKKCKICKNNL